MVPILNSLVKTCQHFLNQRSESVADAVVAQPLEPDYSGDGLVNQKESKF